MGQEHFILRTDSKIATKCLWPVQPQCSQWVAACLDCSVHGQREVLHTVNGNIFYLKHFYACWGTTSDGSLDHYWHWLSWGMALSSRLLPWCSNFGLHRTSCGFWGDCNTFMCRISVLHEWAIRYKGKHFKQIDFSVWGLIPKGLLCEKVKINSSLPN